MRSLFDAFFSITAALEQASIPYAVIGGLAMAFHDIVRATRDIDLLIVASDDERVTEELAGLGFGRSGPPFPLGTDPHLVVDRFVSFSGDGHTQIDIMISDDTRIAEILERSVSIDPGNGPVSIASIDDLIFLKRLRNSEVDRLDIARLEQRRGAEE